MSRQVIPTENTAMRCILEGIPYDVTTCVSRYTGVPCKGVHQRQERRQEPAGSDCQWWMVLTKQMP